ncbi:PiggyBac transposable element-derived protein 4-like protein [Plakobranchus ocellatus]|uniref:PiggyBac transposable element-derived protein 4-like protein n=1 Tax=Plakobranchus ocellatus TaxID=259542 RepID=A0AAV4CFL4_9GAST|nr:PiggyBac transposable element-derived protein 4-like protein [Plakobranchus ocellatus]
MERNLFQSLNVPLDDDDYENGNLSDEVELSDEDEWVPPCEESEDSESSDEGHTYTELAPANVNIVVPLDGTSNDPYEGEDATSSSNSIVLGKDKQTDSLLNHLRFDDKATRSARRARDVFAPMRELWDLFHTNLGKHYVAGQNITVDEQLVPFRGRCSFIQYMPSKPDKYGLKFFWASDAASNYPLRGFPYLGKEATSARSAERTMGIAASTVERLTQVFKGTGRNITCDNYFTDLKLAESLAKQKLTMIGTVKRNKTFLPVDFQAKKALPLGESKFLFRHETTLVSFQSKRPKNVILLSTTHQKPEICPETTKPDIGCVFQHIRSIIHCSQGDLSAQISSGQTVTRGL